MRTYDFNTATTGTVQATGSFVRYQSGSAGGADTGIVIRPEGSGSSIELVPGDWVRLSRSVAAFAIAARTSGATVAGKLLIGDGDAGAASVAGTVEVIDGGKSRTLAGSAFMAVIALSAGGVGQFTHAQLWNPPGSGKRVIVSGVRTACTSSTQIAIVDSNAALTTLWLPNFQSKRLDLGGSSAAQGRSQYNATLLGANALDAFAVSAGIPVFVQFKEPVVITENRGLLVRQNNSQLDLTATFEFIEEAAT